jgi:hypothetical protein
VTEELLPFASVDRFCLDTHGRFLSARVLTADGRLSQLFSGWIGLQGPDCVFAILQIEMKRAHQIAASDERRPRSQAKYCAAVRAQAIPEPALKLLAPAVALNEYGLFGRWRIAAQRGRLPLRQTNREMWHAGDCAVLGVVMQQSLTTGTNHD